MQKTILILSLTMLFTLLSCGDKNKGKSNNWTRADRQEFLTECNADGSMYNYCKCVLDDLENTFPDVNEIDRNYGKVENHILNVSVGKCAEELYDIDANSFNPDFDLEKSDYEIFMDECNLNGSMTKYCDCAYNKYIEYGIDYYMNNIDRVVEECGQYIY